MAGFVVSPNTLRVLWHLSTHGRNQLYVTHAEYTLAGPLNPNIAETIFSSFKGALGAGPPGALANTFSFLGVGVVDIRSANNVEIASTGAAVPGTSLLVGLPDQVACVVTLRTAFAGRSFRGRVYVFGWAEDQVTAEGLVSDSCAINARQIVEAMRVGITAAGGTMAIRSPALPERPSKPGGVLPAKPYAITPVTTTVVRDRIWDTNRRRIDTLRR
jgi:hypothetical protein